MASTASERMVFVLGKELHGNRQVLIVEDGEEYDLDADDAVEYDADETTQFPYEI
jgi:hypothetical protein